MDKITEEVLTSLINKIEQLEQKFKKYESTNSTNYAPISEQSGTKPGMATENQLKFIRGLGGDPWEDMTKQEAGHEIEELKKHKEKKIPKRNGLDTDKIQNSHTIEEDEKYDIPVLQKKLTEEEIEELGEEAFL